MPRSFCAPPRRSESSAAIAGRAPSRENVLRMARGLSKGERGGIGDGSQCDI